MLIGTLSYFATPLTSTLRHHMILSKTSTCWSFLHWSIYSRPKYMPSLLAYISALLYMLYFKGVKLLSTANKVSQHHILSSSKSFSFHDVDLFNTGSILWRGWRKAECGGGVVALYKLSRLFSGSYHQLFPFSIISFSIILWSMDFSSPASHFSPYLSLP